MRSTPLPPATVLCMPLSHDSQSLLLLPVINPINPTQFRFSTCGQLLQHSCNCVDIHKFGECRVVTGNRSAASATATQKALTRLALLPLPRSLCRYAANVVVAGGGYVGIVGAECS
ncbi:hypothetical protein ACLKA7_001542 [Drosophila subpalustris]